MRFVSLRSLLLWCVTILAFMLFSDLLTLALGKPLVPPNFADLYASASAPFLLMLALVAAAPLLEELFFRGFILSALDSLGIPFRVGAGASSLAWAAIHSQYGLYELTLIFAMGLLLAEARYRSRSIVPCIAMHSVSNMGAFVEAALMAP